VTSRRSGFHDGFLQVFYNFLFIFPSVGHRDGGRFKRVYYGISGKMEERPHGFAREITLISKRAGIVVRDLDASAVGRLGRLICLICQGESNNGERGVPGSTSKIR
jgi:hypothetical protein